MCEASSSMSLGIFPSGISLKYSSSWRTSYGYLSVICIDPAILDAVPGILVDLMKADFLAFRCGWEQGNRTRDKRQFEIALPIRTRGHDLLHTNERHWF